MRILALEQRVYELEELIKTHIKKMEEYEKFLRKFQGGAQLINKLDGKPEKKKRITKKKD